MGIQAAEFVRRVIAGQSVRGEHVEGEVQIPASELKATDWSGCRFDASILVKDCSAKHSLSLNGAVVTGDVLIDGLTFKPALGNRAGLSLRGLKSAGNVCLTGVNHSDAELPRISVTGGELLDEFWSGHFGLDLSSMQIAQSLQVARCVQQKSSNDAALCLDFTTVGTFADLGVGVEFSGWAASNFHVRGNCLVTVEPDSATASLLFSNMVCEGSLSVAIGNQNLTHLILSGARTGILKIASCGKSQGQVYDLDLAQVTIAGNCSIKNLAVCEIEMRGLNCLGTLFLSSLTGIDRPSSKGAVTKPRISLIHATAAKDLALGNLKAFENIDASAANVGNILKIYECTGIDTIEIKYCRANQVEIWLCDASNLYAWDIQVGGISLESVRVTGMVNLMRARVQGGGLFTRVTAQELDLTAATFGNRFRIDPDRSELKKKIKGLGLDRLGNVFAGCDDGADVEPPADRLSLVKELEKVAGFPLISTFQRLCLDDSEIPLIDLSGALMTRASTPGNPAISARRMRVKSQLKVRADQFLSEFSMQPCRGIGEPAVLDLTQSQIGELDMGEPLPASITLRGVTVENWGIKECGKQSTAGGGDSVARRYDAILLRADAFERRQYLRIETDLENSGQRGDADELHRIWRTHARRNLPIGLARTNSWLHDKVLGYGTKRMRLILGMAGVGAFAFVLAFVSYDDSFQISSSVLATLAECGEPCADRRPPTLASNPLAKAWDSAQLVLRHGVPLVDLQLGNHLEPKAGSIAAQMVSVLRGIGWITWPVLLTSLLASFFPKRHQA